MIGFKPGKVIKFRFGFTNGAVPPVQALIPNSFATSSIRHANPNQLLYELQVGQPHPIGGGVMA